MQTVKLRYGLILFSVLGVGRLLRREVGYVGRLRPKRRSLYVIYMPEDLRPEGLTP